MPNQGIPDSAAKGLQIWAPDRLNFDSSNIQKEWRQWKAEMELYTQLALGGSNEQTKIQLFKYLIGPEGREVYETLITDQATLSDVMQVFNNHYCPKKSEIVERYRFFMRYQCPTNYNASDIEFILEILFC